MVRLEQIITGLKIPYSNILHTVKVLLMIFKRAFYAGPSCLLEPLEPLAQGLQISKYCAILQAFFLELSYFHLTHYEHSFLSYVVYARF